MAVVGEPLFQVGVRMGGLVVPADIVPEIDVALDFARRLLCVGVQVVSTNAMGIISAKISTAG
jgi:hypothetical protein